MTLDGGTLQTLASGFSSGCAVTLTSSGGTVNTNGFNATLTGAISGGGGLTSGMALNLAGASTYSSSTSLVQGELCVTGSITSSTTVYRGGPLGDR